MQLRIEVCLFSALFFALGQVAADHSSLDGTSTIRGLVRLKQKPKSYRFDPDYDPFDHINPDIDNEPIVKKFNYPVEKHKITTEDGYRLLAYRIPGHKVNPSKEKKTPVLLIPGAFCISTQWIVRGPGIDLAYLLADEGYDVWMSNNRGTGLARAHVSLDPDYDAEYWNFSWHEMGVYDHPANIDYILNATGKEAVIYIGHSMGTTSSYVLLSTRPEYNDKVALAISLAPVAYWYQPLHPIVNALKPLVTRIQTMFDKLQIYEIFPNQAGMRSLTESMCKSRNVRFRNLCLLAITNVIDGPDIEQLPDLDTLIKFTSFMPAGMAKKSMSHYGQNMINNGDFRMYDYGEAENVVRYGTKIPPKYALKNIKTPIALVFSFGDVYNTPENVYYLAKDIPNLETVEAVPDHKFTHLDFIFAKDVKTLLNDRLMQMMAKYST
ncbi:hypothetical protein TKK_0006870 [Trichogramma kaykai]|uniref:Lipase n=1 Tax=Trichogramma kaykai TaxID=54128 RepID=A0ABD2X9U5_9HYME